MNKYINAQKLLAELLGWTNICTNTFDSRILMGTDRGVHMAVPNWHTDDREAFILMVKYELNVFHVGGKIAYACDEQAYVEEQQDYRDNSSDPFLATRYAIMKAVICKLENALGVA